MVLPISALTEKDRADLVFALELGADWIALSFVQRPEDMAEARKLVGGRAGVMAKLEKPAAIERLDEIIELSDAVMVARGDLGVELPPEDVPGLQKRIVRACRKAGKPVIVATQMLESMVDSPTPTRAEASDVATAVYDGADAVMLSAETAVGALPGRGGRDDGPHHARRVEQRPALPTRRRGRPSRRGDQRRRDHAPRRARSPQTIGAAAIVAYISRGAHHPARRARAARGADPGPDAEDRVGAAPGAGLGRPLGPHRGRP